MVKTEKEYHIQLSKSDIKGARYAIMPGDPGRVEKIAAYLEQLGVDTFIRVGTSGGMQEKVLPGDIINVNGAIRAEGTSREYVGIEYPAVSDFEVTRAIDDGAEFLKIRHHTGVVHCKDSFYGQHSPKRMPVAGELLSKWECWIRAGALVSEMETAALFTGSGPGP